MNETDMSGITRNADEFASFDAEPKMILTIDDEAVIRDSIEAYLEDCGYGVLQAENGRRGLEVFRSESPDLVLVDLRMPEIDGLDVLASVTRESPLTPVIVVSGTGVLHDAIEALRLGAWDFVTKPIQDMDVLHRAVGKALERAQQLHRRVRYREELERDVERRTHELLEANHRLNEQMRERERAEARLVESLREKEVLLKEIHHRVKNNLQIISSLLYLQSQHIRDEDALAIFTESRSRVKSMALVHEKLYQSQDLARIDYREYLENFVGYLMQTYHASTRTIALNLEVDDVYLPVDCAIPTSLIINELVTNALKYAWGNAASGTLSVGLVSNGSKVELWVRDDGQGLPKDFDWEQSETLGMQLVVNLVQQLRGDMNVSCDGGTSFTIRFGC
ncbi:two-component sensor histidine kinase/CheY-like chemotaxis protein [Desulfobaculum xiamenense]|uniref:Two-component sensor histidine kinase/CheY-like chemotaxis protein n=1 Tax=Desulfobaculum xiamenense TaxID=995050 RepID=A0A846QNZ9_9BACT|nr:histidine kinase dimerization/phosphoacceptor domain -containing protein [Desulfobaculum xiamenense]NJB68740.1 two-component sensor histidine kinase/CheY-like chemotaxis protein [Desulfobaculum xiamenense]